MKNEKTVTLNDRGIALVVLVILTLTFALGFMTSTRAKEQEVTVFTREELERIVKLQEIEDEQGSGADIYAYKDQDGNLMIGWDYNSKR